MTLLILKHMKVIAGMVLLFTLIPAKYLPYPINLSQEDGVMGRGKMLTEMPEGVYGYVREEDGSPVGNVDISIFDGFTVHTVKTDSNGMYNILEVPVSINRYAVIFLTKEGYVPMAVNIKVHNEKGIEYSTVMKQVDAGDAGFIIGTVYQPIRGGKIKFQSGIYGFGKNKQVWLERDGGVIEMTSDMDGHFVFEILPGAYQLGGEGVRKKVKVEVSVGQTEIRNLRSGLVLID